MSKTTRRNVRIALAILAAAAAAVWLRHTLLALMQIIFGALILAFLLSPLAKMLERRFSGSIAALLSILAVIISVAAIMAVVLPGLVVELMDLGNTLTQFVHEIKRMYEVLRAWAQGYGIALPAPEGFSDISAQAASLASGTVIFAGNLANGLYRASLIVVLGYFFLADREQLALRVELLIPSRIRPRIVRLGNCLKREMRIYVRGQALISLAVGALSSIGLMLVGVRSALVLGMLVGILNLIPYFGPILGSIPAVIMALDGGISRAFLAVVVLVAVQQMDGLIISPRIMGSLTGISPAAVLLAIFVGSSLSGIGGMLIALPCLIATRTLFRVLVQNEENI